MNISHLRRLQAPKTPIKRTFSLKLGNCWSKIQKFLGHSINFTSKILSIKKHPLRPIVSATIEEMIKKFQRKICKVCTIIQVRRQQFSTISAWVFHYRPWIKFNWTIRAISNHTVTRTKHMDLALLAWQAKEIFSLQVRMWVLIVRAHDSLFIDKF